MEWIIVVAIIILVGIVGSIVAKKVDSFIERKNNRNEKKANEQNINITFHHRSWRKKDN